MYESININAVSKLFTVEKKGDGDIHEIKLIFIKFIKKIIFSFFLASFYFPPRKNILIWN